MTQYDFSRGLALEQQISSAIGHGLKYRWEFGRWMLTHVPGDKKKLPDGFLPALERATGTSRAELGNRRQFAVQFDKQALANAVRQRRSWHEISNVLLGTRADGNGQVIDPSEIDEWESPQDLFDQLGAEFGFELDVCARPSNARCERFFSPEEDGLRRPWRGSCWMNPPHREGLEQWVAKARRAAESDRKTTVVCLLPAKVDAAWWWEHCLTAEIRFFPGRLKYDGERDAPYPYAVVIFGRKPRVVWWDRGQEQQLKAVA